MDALIVGAGLAGCMSALMLHNAGATCRIIDGGPSYRLGVAADHAHRFTPEDLDVCASLIGAAPWELAQCGRAGLLRRLRSAVEASVDVRWGQRLQSLTPDPQGWTVSVASHPLGSASRVIDASGGSYAAAEMAVHAEGLTLNVSHLADRWEHTSWRLRSPDLRPGSTELDGGFVLAANDGDEVVVTAALPAHEARELEEISRAVEQALDLPRGALKRPSARYKGSALMRSHIPPDSAVLGVGDALIRTPPRFGDGLHHALETARLSSLNSISEASQSLAMYADQIWSGATLAMAFEKAPR